MSNESKPGTYGAIVRSTEPMPWRQMLSRLTFTAEEFVNDPAIPYKRASAVLDEFLKRPLDTYPQQVHIQALVSYRRDR